MSTTSPKIIINNNINTTTTITTTPPTTTTITTTNNTATTTTTTTTTTTNTTNNIDDKPRDAKLMELLMASMGINDCDEQVIPLLLEFAHRHITDLITQAMIYAQHANRYNELNLDDIKLAIQSKISHSFTSPPPRDFLVQLATEKNSTPLPLIPERHGIRVPSKQFTLTGAHYNIIPTPLHSNISTATTTNIPTTSSPLVIIPTTNNNTNTTSTTSTTPHGDETDEEDMDVDQV